ncbi:hypothetical protein [Streptomyces sp. NPDC102283]|uniref:hypothetical protein n=1 Tax=Streptomyces sp. NPDC102283 TaxID=3366155 RepID=UPI0037FC7B1A
MLSFALVVDGPADHEGDRNTLVPDLWLTAHADLDIPTLRQAAALPLPTAGEQFDQLVAAVVERIRGGLGAG